MSKDVSDIHAKVVDRHQHRSIMPSSSVANVQTYAWALTTALPKTWI